ncbi:MAG: hypothetical protein JO024_09335 [Candidatus Eremiobacteraeota bacterium]|nr:hypothetical protein [Candidatus Eremiobacteraeota bacterium]
MSGFVIHLLHAAAWTFFIIFLFAIIGVIAVLRWIAELFMRGESAVKSGVSQVEGSIHHREP